MCRAALETEEGGQKAEAVNNGIVYLKFTFGVRVRSKGVTERI